MGPLKVGTKLSDKYRIERLMAESGGVVLYEATDVPRSQKVWVKILQRDSLHKADALERFQRDANGAKVLDVGKSTDGLPYVVASEFGSDAASPPPGKAVSKKPPALPGHGAKTNNPKSTLPGVAPPPGSLRREWQDDDEPPPSSSIPLTSEDVVLVDGPAEGGTSHTKTVEPTPRPPEQVTVPIATVPIAPPKPKRPDPRVEPEDEPFASPFAPIAGKAEAKPEPPKTPSKPAPSKPLSKPAPPPPMIVNEPEIRIDAALPPMRALAKTIPPLGETVVRRDQRKSDLRWTLAMLAAASLTGVAGFYLGRDQGLHAAAQSAAATTAPMEVASAQPSAEPVAKTADTAAPTATATAAATATATETATPTATATTLAAAAETTTSKPHVAPPVHAETTSAPTHHATPKPHPHASSSDPLTL